MGDPDDIPYRLPDIIPLAYPHGGMTLTGLRREIARGNLVVEKTAGKFFVTLRAINEMRAKCRVQPKGLDSGSDQLAPTKRPAGSSRTRNGSSSTGLNRSAQDVLEERLTKRSDSLRSTSSTNGARRVASGA
jgi:hypothetical protein